MTKIIVDEPLRAKLNGLESEAELCDEAGQILGHFVPKGLYSQLYGWAKSQFSDEELEQARQEAGGFTTAEVLDHLNRL
jgi:hypothetical protein